MNYSSASASLKNGMAHLLLIIAWLGMWRLSILMEYAPHASIWFPPAGLTFAAYLILRWRALPAIFLACIISTFWESVLFNDLRSSQELLTTGSFFALIHSLAYGGGAALIRGAISQVNSYNLYHLVMRFLIVVALSSLLMALIGTYFIYHLDLNAAFTDTWLAWWIGDMSGILVLAPLFVGVINRLYPQVGLLQFLRFKPLNNNRLPFIVKVWVSCAYLLSVMALANYFNSVEIAFFVFFLMLPQMWIVYTETPFRTSISLAVFSFFIAAVVAVVGMGQHAYIYQFAINVIAFGAYFAMAVPALVSDNKLLHEKAHVDSLTMAHSRDHFFALAEQHLKHAQRYRHSLSLVLFDIDKFKHINDTFGHSIGDMVLFDVASLVRLRLRESDVFGRFGGDEFMVLLPHTAIQQAHDIAETLRTTIDTMRFEEANIEVSCSFGVAEVLPSKGLQEAFDEADRNLYQAKHEGRNQVCISVSEDTQII